MKKSIRKIISFLLSAVILLSVFPLSVNASDKKYSLTGFNLGLYVDDNCISWESYSKYDGQTLFPNNTLNNSYSQSKLSYVIFNFWKECFPYYYDGEKDYITIKASDVKTVKLVVDLGSDNRINSFLINSCVFQIKSRKSPDSESAESDVKSYNAEISLSNNILTFTCDLSEYKPTYDYISYACFFASLNNFKYNGTYSNVSFNIENAYMSFLTADDNYQSGVTSKLNDIVNSLKSWFNSIFEWLSSIVENIKNGFSNLTSSISGFFTDLTSNLKTWFNNVGGWFSDLSGNLKNWFKNVGDWFSDLGDNLSEWFADVGEWFTNLVNSISSFFTELGNKLKTWFENVGQWFIDIGDRISGFFSDLWENITIKVEGITQDIRDWWQSVKDFFHSLFVPEDGFFEQYKLDWDNFFKEHFGLLYDITDFISTIFMSISDGLSSEASGLVTIPQISLPRNFVGKGTSVLLAKTVFDLNDIINGHNQIKWIFTTFQVFASAIIYLALLMRSKKIFETIIEDRTGG